MFGAMRALRPHWTALLALALFLAGGLVVVDDYGVAQDEILQRSKPVAAVEFLQGDLDALPLGHNKFYGVALELPLLLVERAIGLRDVRDIYLSRHLLTHLLFLGGGLFAYFLASRLLRSRLAALYAMLVFLLHPRLYAQSFPSSIDVPFFVLFAVALYLTRRAFRMETLGAFILLGVGVGALLNIRIMGAVLLAAVLALRALDLALASGWAERKRILFTTGAFGLAAGLTVFASLPYLWADPVGRAVEWWTTLSDHPTKPYELFRGTLYRSDEFPADYVPTWFSITSPPFALALGLIGATVVLVRAARSPRTAVRSGTPRFGLLLVGCVAAPIAAVMLLNANIYNGWRHVYFLWAPFSLLAALGLAWLASAVGRARFRAAVYGAAGTGATMTLISMALIHPNQQVYFNFSVDRVAPERLRTQYVMDYWGNAIRQAFEWLARSEFAGAGGANVSGDAELAAMEMLPDAVREKLRKRPSPDAFVIGNFPEPLGPALHSVRVYADTLATVRRKSDLKAVYAVVAEREPFIDSVFDLHLLGGDLAIVKEPCAPSFVETRLAVQTTPVDAGDLPSRWSESGFERQSWPLAVYGAAFDGVCAALVPYPDYAVDNLEIGWEPDLMDDATARDANRRAEEDGRLMARAAYDVYLADGELVYVNDDCDPLETEHTFFLNIYSQRADDLPEDRQGFERVRFDFHRNGALLPETCVALFPLPDYPVAGFRTGQRREDGNAAWRAEFSANPESYRAAYRAAASSEPAARSVFDVHLSDGALVYVKEPCAQADTEDRFFLHVVPQSADDLPEGRREHGFDGLDFDFFLNGAWFDGRCAAQVALPDYPIASVRTGQYVSGAGEIWSVEFAR